MFPNQHNDVEFGPWEIPLLVMMQKLDNLIFHFIFAVNPDAQSRNLFVEARI